MPSGVIEMYSCLVLLRGMYDNRNFPGYCGQVLNAYGILQEILLNG